jgi:hypothetical protein
MKTITRGWLSLLLLGTALSAQSQTPIRSLLRVHSSHSQSGHGLELTDEDVFIATDRSVERIASLAQNGSLLPPSWLRESKTAIGSPADFATLTAVLTDNQVGQQAGACSVPPPVALPSAAGSTEITWYSRGVRKSVFVIEINGASAPCSEEVQNILSGIEAYEVAAGVP